MATILTIGEALWDVFPDASRLGGAPANVAFHLRQAGHDAMLASAVGDDERGRAALAELRKAGVDTALVTTDPEHPTGVVQVELDDRGVPTFDIRSGVAWDHIPLTPALLNAAGRADAIVFGTLSQRLPESSATIAAALEVGNNALRVLDLNLRPPHYGRDVVQASIARATILKLSDSEVEELQRLLAAAGHASFLPDLMRHYDLRRIYVTRGADGCDVVDGEQVIHIEGTEAEVADTVGAGDAFTAAMVDGELRGLAPERIAAKANRVGAYVASQAGAMAAWPAELREG